MTVRTLRWSVRAHLVGDPVGAVTLARLPLSSISASADGDVANSWREQRAFQVGVTFYC